MTISLTRAFVIAALFFPTAYAATKSPVTFPVLQRDGSVLLPNQWSLRPVGKHTVVGDFPVNIALHPAGAFAAVLHSGWGQHEVRILDAKTGALVSQVALEETFYGLTWSPDGGQLYISGAAAEVIHAFAFKEGYLSEHRELRLRDPFQLQFYRVIGEGSACGHGKSRCRDQKFLHCVDLHVKSPPSL